ncbi:MAG: hypothetical protein WD767_02605 [Alphaproteobacteria bacterium]
MAIALIAAALLIALGFAASNADADDAVHRGSAVETVDAGRTETVVMRGGGSLRDRAAPAEAKPLGIRVTAGKTLWLVDEEGRKVTACSLSNADYAETRRIVCTRE